MIKPPKLNAGDKIAVVSSSWGGAATFPDRFDAGKRQLEDVFDVQVVEMPHTSKSAQWLHDNPKARAQDLMDAFADPDIKGIISSIGGDDSIRLLPFIDLNIIRDNPKVFMGYSDATVSNFMCYAAGLVSFYGPTIMSGFAENGGLFPYMEQMVRKTLFAPQSSLDIPQAESWTVEHLDWSNPDNQSTKRTMQPALGRKVLQGKGVVDGHLIGGCVDVFPMIVGTSIWPDKAVFDGAILFLETSEEAPSVDFFKRILRNLGAQEILSSVNGIILGRPGGELKPEEITQYDDALLDVVRNEYGLTDKVIMTQLDFGHTDPMCVLPLGVQARIECENKSLTLLEAGVS